MRSLPKRLIEDFEVYFQKESVSQGFCLQKIDDQGDYIYFILRGICKIIYPVNNLTDIFVESVICDASKQKYFVLGHMHRGEMFGE